MVSARYLVAAAGVISCLRLTGCGAGANADLGAGNEPGHKVGSAGGDVEAAFKAPKPLRLRALHELADRASLDLFQVGGTLRSRQSR